MTRWLRVAAGFGLLAVALGAFGAHALRGQLEPKLMSAYETAVLYQLVHSVALLALALHGTATKAPLLWPMRLFAAGMVLFCGSLYALTLFDARAAGPVTPLGGLALLAGWSSLLLTSPAERPSKR